MVIALVAAALAGAPATVDGETVAIVRGGVVELYRGGVPAGALWLGGAHVDRLVMAGDAVYASSSDRGRLWVGEVLLDGRARVHAAWVGDDGVAWATDGTRGSRIVLASGATDTWKLPPYGAAGEGPLLPALAPAVLPALRSGCLVVGAGDVGACSESGHTALIGPEGGDGTFIAGVLVAAGRAGLVVKDKAETRVLRPDGTLLHTAPFVATQAGVGRDGAVLVDGATAWVVRPDGGATSFPLAPERPDRDAWDVVLGEPALRVGGPDAVAWYAADDLALIAALPVREGRVVVAIPGGARVRTRADRPTAQLRRFSDDRWLFDVDGKTAWELAVTGKAGPLVPGGVQLFYGADDLVRGLDRATGRERWRAPVQGLAGRTGTLGDGRLLLAGKDGWALLDVGNGKMLATAAGPPKDTRLFPRVFVDAAGGVRGPDGRVLGQIAPDALALGVLADGGLVSVEDGALVVRDGDRVRWWQVPEPGARQVQRARVVGDAVFVVGPAAIIRLDGRTGEVTAAAPWRLGTVSEVE